MLLLKLMSFEVVTIWTLYDYNVCYAAHARVGLLNPLLRMRVWGKWYHLVDL